MTQDALTCISSLFTDIWSIFTSITVPGTNLTFANLWVGVLFAWAIVAFIEKVLGISGDGLSDDYSAKSKFYRDKDMDWRY